MDRLTEKRQGQWVIPLRQDGKNLWSLCSAGMGDAPAKYLYGEHADRLAAYENTGLEPEAIEGLVSVREITPEAEYAINKHANSLIERMDALLHQDDSELAEYRALGSIDHLRELVQAEKDGRVVVLPCKFGSKVYVMEDVGDWHDIPCGHESECEVCSTDCHLYNQKYVVEKVISERFAMTCLDMQLVERGLGKTVFLTREEAEAALSTEKGDTPC